MAKFIKVPTFDIYDETTGEWADPEQRCRDGEIVYQSDLLREDDEAVRVTIPDRFPTDLASIPRFPPIPHQCPTTSTRCCTRTAYLS